MLKDTSVETLCPNSSVIVIMTVCCSVPYSVISSRRGREHGSAGPPSKAHVVELMVLEGVHSMVVLPPTAPCTQSTVKGSGERDSCFEHMHICVSVHHCTHTCTRTYVLCEQTISDSLFWCEGGGLLYIYISST